MHGSRSTRYLGVHFPLGEMRHEPWGAFVRYGVVAYFAAELWPRLARRFVH